MSGRVRRAGRLLARLAAILVGLLLVAALALRLWSHYRFDHAKTAFLQTFGPGEPEGESALEGEDGGAFLRAAALVIGLSLEEQHQINLWMAAGAPLSSDDADRLSSWLQRERIPLELLVEATRREPIRLLSNAEMLEVERVALVPEAQKLGALARLLVARELESRARSDPDEACTALLGLGRLARGLRGGSFLIEQQLAGVPETLLWRRLRSALAIGDPLPCHGELAQIAAKLDPIGSTRRAIIEEGRALLLPERLVVLPAERAARATILVGLLFEDPRGSIVRAALLDATREALDRSAPASKPVEAPRAADSTDAENSWTSMYRVVLRLAEVADAQRRLALAALSVRARFELVGGGEDALSGALDAPVPLTGTIVVARPEGDGSWSLELEGASEVAERLHLRSPSAELLHWSIGPPREPGL